MPKFAHVYFPRPVPLQITLKSTLRSCVRGANLGEEQGAHELDVEYHSQRDHIENMVCKWARRGVRWSENSLSQRIY